jgi:arsenical pump membrane protein
LSRRQPGRCARCSTPHTIRAQLPDLRHDSRPLRRRGNRLGWLLAATGGAAAIAAIAVEPAAARQAAGQDWQPFALVAGLLIGTVADRDGLFQAGGQQIARLARSGIVLFCGCVVLISVVTALLNLDTAVAFLTPVLVYTARSRGGGERPLLYGCLLLANAGSVLLPGSNLTNLIVLGHLHLSGALFASRMWLAWLAAVAVTAAAVAFAERRELRTTAPDPGPGARPLLGLGLAAVLAATALVVILRAPAIPVLIAGLAAAGLRRLALRDITAVLGLPVLAGLLGIAVALGTLGRIWTGPSVLLAHLGSWATAGVAAVAAVLVNNLPAASLLAARVPSHPFALLIGLNLGPNLLASGSLAWILWLKSARTAGADPSLLRASRLGAIAVPLSMAAALAALMVTAGPV